MTLSIIEISRNGNHSVLDFRAQVSLGSLLHLGKNHSTNFFWFELFSLPLKRDFDRRLLAIFDDFERPKLERHMLVIISFSLLFFHLPSSALLQRSNRGFTL